MALLNIRKIKRKRKMDKVMKRLDEIADQYECDGECDCESPYEKCPGCAACSLINELSDIAFYGLRLIEKKIREKDSE